MDDGALIVLRQHGKLGGPRVVLSHGNGLAIDGYLPFWGPLCERYEVVLFDFRNHGRNPLHGASGHNYPTFVRDVERLCNAIGQSMGRQPAAGIFHSLAAVTAILHTLEYGRRFDLLVLFDPPFYARDGHPLQTNNQFAKNDLVARARRRTERYKNPDDFARQLASIPAFRRWVPEAYSLMARATLRPDPASGDWVLACPRELEARIFESTADPTIWPRMANLQAPTKLICADPDAADAGPPALVGRAMASELPIEYEAIQDTSHFLQIERPKECIRATEEFLKKHGFLAQH